MADQLEEERRLTGDAGFVTLMKEMVFVPGNRKRMIISIILMISQQVRRLTEESLPFRCRFTIPSAIDYFIAPRTRVSAC